MKSLKQLLIACFFILTVLFCNGQIRVSGKIQDSLENSIEKASVVITSHEGNILGYNYSDFSGSYSINTKSTPSNYITVSVQSLGFVKKVDTIVIIPSKKDYEVSFNLNEKVESLNEVVLKSNEKIQREGNKIVYMVDAFNTGSEQTVEDVLKNLPGVEVLKDGTIRAHGRNIDKLLIEGEDMFDKKYTMLSKNLDAKVLTRVEILEGFEDNPVLAKVLESGKVAINLVLKEEYKNIWFGNASLGLGTQERFKLASNIGLIKEKIKFFNFNDYNNLGFFAQEQLHTGQEDSGSSFDQKRSLPEIDPIYEVVDYQLSFFKDNEDVFNEAFINSLSFVKSIKPNLKLRGTGYFSNDIGKQFVSSTTKFNTLSPPITYNEKNTLNINKTTIGGEIELKYNDGEKSYLKNVLVYKNEPFKTLQNLVFNDSLIREYQNQRGHTVFNHLNHSFLLGKKNILHNYIYFGSNQRNQDINLYSPTINNIFSQQRHESVGNLSQDRSTIIGGKSSILINIAEVENTIDFGYERIVDKRENIFKLGVSRNNIRVDTLENHLKYRQQAFELNYKSKYKLSRKMELLGGLSVAYLYGQTESLSSSDLFLNPSFGIRLKNLKIGTFSIQYTKDFITPFSNFFLEHYQLSGYQSFYQGTDKITFIQRNKYRFAYHLSNNLQTQSISVRLLYTNSSGRYTTNSIILEDLSFATLRFVDTGDNFVTKIDLTSYFKRFNLSTNFGTLQNVTKTIMSLNSNDFEEISLHTATYFLSGRTYFKIPVNFIFNLSLINSKSSYRNSEFKSTWKSIFIEANYKLSETLIINFNNKFYYLNQGNYGFVNAGINYTPKKAKWSFQVDLNNLMNENSFTLDNVNEISSYQQTTSLLPRYVFGLVKYRF